MFCAILGHRLVWPPVWPASKWRNTWYHGVCGTGSHGTLSPPVGLPSAPYPTPRPRSAQTLAQVSRDLYLRYRIHRRRRTQEFHFLSLV